MHSYPKIYNFNHVQVSRIMDDTPSGRIVVQEKVDGSQLSFGVFDGELIFKSRKRVFRAGEQDKLFDKAVEVVTGLALILQPGFTYRCEYLAKRKHHTIEYPKLPLNNLALYDVERQSEGDFMNPYMVVEEASRLGIDRVLTYSYGFVKDPSQFLDQQSRYGGGPIEGVVIKNYSKINRDGKVMMAKIVAEQFRETHKVKWKQQNPGNADLAKIITDSLRTEARWQKSVQHLAESGELKNNPSDIGPLMKAVNLDVREECEDEIKETLFKHFWPKISRDLTRGLPEWYKEWIS